MVKKSDDLQISMNFIKKNHLFGEASVGVVKEDKTGRVGYFIGNICVLLSEKLRKLEDPIIRIMYTGEDYGTGLYQIVVECKDDIKPQYIYEF